MLLLASGQYGVLSGNHTRLAMQRYMAENGGEKMMALRIHVLLLFALAYHFYLTTTSTFATISTPTTAAFQLSAAYSFRDSRRSSDEDERDSVVIFVVNLSFPIISQFVVLSEILFHDDMKEVAKRFVAVCNGGRKAMRETWAEKMDSIPMYQYVVSRSDRLRHAMRRRAAYYRSLFIDLIQKQAIYRDTSYGYGYNLRTDTFYTYNYTGTGSDAFHSDNLFYGGGAHAARDAIQCAGRQGIRSFIYEDSGADIQRVSRLLLLSRTRSAPQIVESSHDYLAQERMELVALRRRARLWHLNCRSERPLLYKEYLECLVEYGFYKKRCTECDECALCEGVIPIPEVTPECTCRFRRCVCAEWFKVSHWQRIGCRKMPICDDITHEAS